MKNLPVKYMRIYKQLQKSILDGSLQPGSPLPSSRILAGQLGVSRNTILEAFAHLEAEGYIESRHGSGVYVKNLPNLHISPVIKKGEKQKNSRKLKTTQKANSPLSANLPLRPGDPDVSKFPFPVFSRITNQIYRELRDADYCYDNSPGYGPLREAIAGYLTLKRQVNCKSDNIMIVNGSQEALFLCAQILVQKNTTVFIENPSYKLARSVFEERGAIIRSIPVDHEGMQVDKISPEAGALIYVTPSHQFPLGYTLGIGRRLKLLEMARKHKMLIIEDDYDSDFRYNGEPLASLQGIPAVGSEVIYIGTLSKILFPAMRIGFCILPARLMNHFLEKRKLMNRQPPIVNQAVTARFIEKGYLYKHLKLMHKIYKERRDFLFDCANKILSEFVSIENSDSGLHLVAYFNHTYDIRKLRQKAAEKNISLACISDFSHDKLAYDGLVLGFSSYDTRKIQMAIDTLADVFKACR